MVQLTKYRERGGKQKAEVGLGPSSQSMEDASPSRTCKQLQYKSGEQKWHHNANCPLHGTVYPERNKRALFTLIGFLEALGRASDFASNLPVWVAPRIFQFGLLLHRKRVVFDWWRRGTAKNSTYHALAKR